MSTLQDFKQIYTVSAKTLGNYQKMTVDELANGFCKALDDNDNDKKDSYCSALMLRFWFNIEKMYSKSPAIGLDIEDFHSWLYEAINYACKYRAWQVNPKVNAQQAINKCIETIRLQHYYEFNLDKHKANYSGVSSLDTPAEEDDMTLMETIPDDTRVDNDGSADYIIQEYIKKNKIVEAIIFDVIANKDPFKYSKKIVKTTDENDEPVKYTEHSTQFWPYRAVQILSNLPTDYRTYFSNRYSIVETTLDVAMEAIHKANNQKLYKYIDRSLTDLKNCFNC